MPSDARPRIEQATTAILLCGDLESLGSGLSLEELCSSLEAACPDIAVKVIPNLCRHLAQLSRALVHQDAARLVLGLCSTEYSPIELQAQARKAGLDPFGVEVVPLGTFCNRVHSEHPATQKAKTLLAAAVARARAYEGSGPEHSKPFFLSLHQRVTRRSFFTLPPIAYQPVPSLREDRCVAEAGCQLCARACPRNALRKTGGRLFLDRAACESCGVCLAACPREAIAFPGWSLPQLEAQLATLLGSARPHSESTGLLLTCQRAVGKLEELARQGGSYSHQWLPVVVPCLGMVTPTWILQILAHGAEAVALLSCGADCPFGQQQAIGGGANFCRRLLKPLGQGERVRVLSASQPERLLQALQEAPPRNWNNHHERPATLLRLGNLGSAFQALQCLATDDGELSEAALEHPHSPFGVVEFQGEGCTMCLTCVEACPTGALASERDGDGVRLTWLASWCTGCGMCADLCPETASQVLRVRRMTSMTRLSRGRVVLSETQMAICEGCGASIASLSLLRHLEASLGEAESESLRAALNRYCPSCRSTLAWGAAASGHHGS